jgi:putative YphP/YqiW family bacilliredoxin
MYDRRAVVPMWKELEAVGVKPLKTPEEVDQAVNSTGIVMVVVNSVCGCAAGACRPAVALALQNSVIPDLSVTVFAGVDREATEKARGWMPKVKPSSPSVMLFKDGQPLYAMERRQIEGRGADQIALDLKKQFDKHCTHKGPSVPAEVVQKAFRLK